MLIGKKKIVLAALVLALGTAIYLNWQFSSSGNSMDLTTMLGSSKNLGDAKYVNDTQNGKVNSSSSSSKSTAKTSTSDFFAQQRVNRQKTRDQAIAVLKSVAEDTKIEATSKQKAVLDIAQIALNVEKEGRCENLIKAKGFSDCVVSISDNSADVVVGTTGLTSAQAVQIKDIMVNDGGIASDKIKIIEQG